jgi:CubicO group peptidase (beta-lactamase class C family)
MPGTYSGDHTRYTFGRLCLVHISTVNDTGAGGAFTTLVDVEKFWKRLLSGDLVSMPTLTAMLSVQSSAEGEYYGYGVWLKKKDETVFLPFFQGSDPGVSFISRYDPQSKLRIHIVSNKGENVWSLASKIEASQT